MLLQNLSSRSQLIRQIDASSITRRCLSSSTSRFSHTSCTKASEAPDNGDNSSLGEHQSQETQIFDERTLITQLSPLKRILCLCPVPLGRGRISWSGGDASATLQSEEDQQYQQQTINLDFQTQYSNKSKSNNNLEMMHQQLQQLSSAPPKVSKYRYGERFAIGVAVSDPYLTHAVPVQLKRNNGYGSARYDEDNGTHCFTAEIVPTFKGDMHNLDTTSPIFHTNLPYFRKDFLQHIGHTDIGAVVLALPMESSRSAFCPMPTKLQLEEERKSEEVREYLFGLLQNYVSSDSGSLDEDEQYGKDGALDSNSNINTSASVPFFGPLNLQGSINHRLSAADVLSKVTEDGNWDHLVKEIRDSHGINSSTSGRRSIFSRGGKTFGENMDESKIGPSTSISPDIHAAVALNAMLERHTIGYHNSFF